MPATFNYSFWNENGRNLRRPDLAFLRTDAHNYRTLLLQLKGEIGFNDSGIWLVAEDETNKKFNSFFDIALDQQVELAITPEYSCPIRIINALLAENKFPTEHNLWVVGCESLHPNQVIELVGTHNEITWIYDEQLVNDKAHIEPQKFFDPVLYLLNTRTAAGDLQKIGIIQFKNYPFGGAEAIWERDNLILGREFYVISNQIESSRLVTLICSDTLDDFDFNTVQDSMFINVPLLIIHIQLNAKPFKDTYKKYRNTVFSKGDKDWNKEMICLNWARNVSYDHDGVKEIFNKYGGSAFYLKSEKINKRDSRINENHVKGLYYTNWHEKRAHIYFLNFDEYVFLVENTKPSQSSADPTQLNRSGPRTLNVYQFNGELWVEKVEKLPDGFSTVIEEFEAEGADLSCISSSIEYVDVERIVELSNGDILGKPDWFTVENLKAFIVDDHEINNRLLFYHDPDEDSLNIKKRKLANYSILKNGIIIEPANLPHGFGDGRIAFPLPGNTPDRYLTNISSTTNSARRATGVYLGPSTRNNAQKVKDHIASLFKETHQGKLVLVWFEGPIGRVREPENIPMPGIKDDVSNAPNSFKKKGKLWT